MLKTKQVLVKIGLFISACVSFAVVAFFLTWNSGILFSFTVASLIVCIFFIARTAADKFFSERIERKGLYGGETGLLSRFIERLRFSYTLDDFIQAVRDVCEDRGGISVLYVDKDENRILYNSPSHIASAGETIEKLALNFGADWEEGCYFFDGELGLVSDPAPPRRPPPPSRPASPRRADRICAPAGSRRGRR